MLGERLRPYVDRADRAVKSLLSRYRDSLFYEPLSEFLQGGKRIRPVLLLISHEACGGSGDPEPAAAAVELIHTASLIHDDLIDRDTSRRGSPAFHVRFGETLAILVSDFVLSLVLDVSSLYGDPAVARILARTTRIMSEGEAEEASIRSKGERINLDGYLSVLEKKTASLFSAAAELGAVIAGTAREVEDALAEYGRLVGLAYQLRDDLLDWGKPGEISSLLDPGAARELEAMSADLADRAVELTEVLPESPVRELLAELARFATRWVG